MPVKSIILYTNLTNSKTTNSFIFLLHFKNLKKKIVPAIYLKVFNEI